MIGKKNLSQIHDFKIEMKICKRCIMDETVPDFEETEFGCNFCDFYYDFKARNRKSEKELKSLIADIKLERTTSGRKYDAIMGISGGYDSSTALQLIHGLGLNILVVHADNFYNKSVTEKNIQALLAYTDYDFRRIVVNREEFVKVQKAVLKSSVINVEAISDLIIQTAIYRTAKEEGIPFVIEGSNITTEALRVPKWGYRNDDKRNLKRIWKKFGDGSKAFKNLKLMNIWEKNKLLSKLTIIRPLNHYDYDPDESRKMLMKTVKGYKSYGGKHQESLITDFYQRYILPLKFDVDKRKVFLSNRVCAKQITRDQALSRLSLPMYLSNMDMYCHLEAVTDIMNIYPADLVCMIFEKEPIPHETYGTDRVLRFLSNVRFKWKKALKKVFM